MDAAFDTQLAEADVSVEQFLKRRHSAWNLVGRVHFNLAENRKDEEAPFAFLATYTTRLSAQAKAQHIPLGKALQEYAGAKNCERLLSLLMPVQRAAEHCPWLKAMVDSGEIFHPLRWRPQQALQLLRNVPALESAGVVVRMPASWRMNRPARPQVKATVGGKPPSHASPGPEETMLKLITQTVPSRRTRLPARQLDRGNRAVCAEPEGHHCASIGSPADGKLKMDRSHYLAGVDLVITSYGFLARTPWLETTPWRLAIFDEAQAIKNPAAKQTQLVKKL